jgi:hypothetical protein
MELPESFRTELEITAANIDSVLADVKENSGISDEFILQVMTSLTFFGKSLKLWEDEMALPIPEGRLDADTIRDLYAELANKIQIANHYYCLAASSNAISSMGVNIRRTDLTTALVTYYTSNNQKIPPSTILDKIADGYLKKLSNLSATNKIVKDFWKEKLSTLKEVKDILSSIAVSYATELKYSIGD